MSQSVRWYIIQTYSGYENAVKQDLERRVESMGMSDFIFRVIVPEETVIEKKADGKEKEKCPCPQRRVGSPGVRGPAGGRR